MTDLETSGEDGDIGRYTLPPHTTKRRTTTNLKTKTNQNCQKIKLYGSQTTKELKKKHSFRLVGGEVQEAQRVPKKLDPRKHTPRHIIIKLPKIKEERILKAAREQERVTYEGVPIRL